MTNHIHFLVTPTHADSASRMMQALGSRYGFFMNKIHKRSGTVWEGRHKSSAVDEQAYLLKCYRYIELNPVRAKMVVSPEEYRWSSYGVNAWGDQSDCLEPHPEYVNLGGDKAKRCFAYRELFRYQLEKDDLHSIRQAAHYSHPLGDTRFVKQIERLSGKAAGYAKRGRPRKIE
jgi:putative transposase